MKEVNKILENNNMEVVWSSIEGDERKEMDKAKIKLKNNQYWPGFFTFLARRI